MFLNTTTTRNRTRFKQIEVHSNRLILICKTKIGQKEVPFETIDKIHLTLNKRVLKSTYFYFVVVGSSIFMGWYSYSFMVLLAIFLFMVMITFFLHYKYWINLSSYPIYLLVVQLKNGNFFIKNISQAHKNDTIVMINHVKREKRLLR